MTVIYWLRRAANIYKPYVSNRVEEIQSVTNSEQWRYCPSKENPADLPSRGITVNDLLLADLWWKGSKFLRLNKQDWPGEIGTLILEKDAREENKLAVEDGYSNQEDNIGMLISDILNCEPSEGSSQKLTSGVKT